MYEIFLKELANYQLNQMYHEAEKAKGFDVEYHEKEAYNSNLQWNATRRISQKILGNKIAMECSIEATKKAKEEFAKGKIYID
jgi:hypothetical protein